MFSTRQKHEISEKVQQVLRDTQHPELPAGEIQFSLRVAGAEPWSWAVIVNNDNVIGRSQVNRWNKQQDPQSGVASGTEEDHA